MCTVFERRRCTSDARQKLQLSLIVSGLTEMYECLFTGQSSINLPRLAFEVFIAVVCCKRICHTNMKFFLEDELCNAVHG